jgi:hypothetical protein
MPDSKINWHSRWRDDDPHTVNRVGADLDRVALQQDLGRLHDCNLLQKCAHTEFSEKNALLPITQNAHGLLSGQATTWAGSSRGTSSSSTTTRPATG